MIDLSNLPWHSFADRGLLLDLNTLLPQEALLPVALGRALLPWR